MNLKYSVIIPVYKAEKTLCRCVDSLLKCNREELEIILVNDGSPDGCGAICEQYAEGNACVKYIAKENGGVSTARNAGIEAASGDYLIFVDSDDYVSEGCFEAIDSVLSECDYDFIQFSHYMTDGKTISTHTRSVFSSNDRGGFFPGIIDSICSKVINPPWAKVYKHELIEKYNIRFPVGASIAEDRAFNIAYSTHINSYRVSDKAVYYVSTENENSLSRKKMTDLDRQFEITGSYARNAIKNADIPETEKEQYFAAMNFGICRGIYKNAKDLHRERVPFFKRLKTIHKLCREMNKRKYRYPGTRYCRLITLPIRMNFALVIDAMAWVLVRR